MGDFGRAVSLLEGNPPTKSDQKSMDEGMTQRKGFRSPEPLQWVDTGSIFSPQVFWI